MEFGVFVGMYHPEHRRAVGRPSSTSCGPSSTSCRRPIAPGSSTCGSPSTTSSTSTPTCRRTRHGWRTLAITDNIHIGSGIINITPPVRHRCVLAEEGGDARSARARALRVRHRARLVVDRGCSASASTPWTPPACMYDEALPEIIKMMRPEEYGPFQGEFFSLPRRQVLPKPVTQPHPPIWVAAGSPARSRRRHAWASGSSASASRAPGAEAAHRTSQDDRSRTPIPSVRTTRRR